MKTARKNWTTEEIEILRKEYPDTPNTALAERLSVTDSAVYRKATALGLKKSEAYLASPAACRLRRGDNIGAATRFRAGHKPHNAGKTGWQAGGNAAKTQFKPGNKPHTWKPVGSERLTKGGYRQRKMTDTGYTPRDWVCLHTMMWEEANGPIPKGHVVVFKNGNNQDIRLDNLALMSRSENMRRNSIHNLPKALAQVCQLKGALQRQINKRMRHEKQD